MFTEKCNGFDSPCVFCARIRSSCRRAWSVPRPQRRKCASARKARRASPIACSNGWCHRRPGHRGARGAVSPDGRWTVSAGADCARLDAERNAVVHGGEVLFKSGAALTVLSQLPGWGWARALRAIPKTLRDAAYNLVARNRYRIFGKYDECFVPDAELRKRVMRASSDC